MMAGAPRIMVAAPASGCGKTTFSCGLMRAFVRRGLAVQACKCGPDYIDPMFHREVVGAASHNLDLYFMGADLVRETVARGARVCDVTVIEGAMGFYDGIAVSDEASAWDVARVTETPVVLVVDGRGRARSVAAEVLGFSRFREPSRIAGVVLNRVSAMAYPRLKELVEEETGVPVLGHVPVLEDCGLESRHLGLVTAAEVADLQGKLDAVARTLEECVNLDEILVLARGASAFEVDEPGRGDRPGRGGGVFACPRSHDGEGRCVSLLRNRSHATTPSRTVISGSGAPVIAVALDDAFCFYYDDTLALFEELGARVEFFSPLADSSLPEGACGLYLGGGYPELHARELSGNAPMLAAVREAVEGGMPTIAECGGFMFLHEELEGDDGAFWPMAGVIRGRSFRTPKLGRFGYVEMTAACDNLLCDAGGKLRAHEFHYWDSDDPGCAFHACKPLSERAWDCVHASASLYAGYPHLCLHAAPEAAARFVRACAAFGAGTSVDDVCSAGEVTV